MLAQLVGGSLILRVKMMSRELAPAPAAKKAGVVEFDHDGCRHGRVGGPGHTGILCSILENSGQLRLRHEDLELRGAGHIQHFSESDPSPIRQCYGGEQPTHSSVPVVFRNPGK